VACFIVVPAIIYFSSYLLFPKTTNAHTISDVINQGARLYGYHSTETTPHPYASKWYTWPLGLTPIFYDYNGENDIIYLFPNYVLAYVSVIALVLTAYVGFKKKDRYSTYILLAWLSLFLPYAFISRPMFLYHYLPASIFALLAIVNMFYHFPKARKIIPLYILLVILSFAISYPKMVGV
jgi:dolichyl-phosphate-mannose--protein O-mannosyl transferase